MFVYFVKQSSVINFIYSEKHCFIIIVNVMKENKPIKRLYLTKRFTAVNIFYSIVNWWACYYQLLPSKSNIFEPGQQGGVAAHFSLSSKLDLM